MARATRSKLESFDIVITRADLDYGILAFSREHRLYLPGYKLDFILETNIGPIITHLTSSNKRNTRIGDPLEGNYISGGRVSGTNVAGLYEWYKHNSLRIDDRVRVYILDLHRRYELKRVK